jgi:SAM-dependent methyltransferase
VGCVDYPLLSGETKSAEAESKIPALVARARLLQTPRVTSQEKAFQDFADFAAALKGDEKSEAQTFLFHLLEAFNHDANTLPEGCTFEYRVRFPGDRTKFADLVWPGRVLVEMKSRGEKLSRHYQQTFDYWLNLVPHRPPYVVLCDFDEFWIYDFNTQLQEPLEKIKVSELRERHSALNFLYPRKSLPIFGNNWINVTRDAAADVANVFNSLVTRGESRENARRFVLQSVVAMFAEDIGLLPEDLFTKLLDESRKSENPTAASYDLIGGLFRQMNDPKPARGGKYAGVDYFNGGLFSKVEPVELQPSDIGLLFEAAKQKWQYVQPVIFGTLFEGSLGKEERHALGAHFTYEADIQKIVRPTIVRPWEERIAAAKNVAELLELLRQLRAFRVLDPACGSGNFLFVAYRALRELEQNLLVKLFTQNKSQFEKVGTASGISPRQFFGLDVNDNAVETAKVTLMLARRLAARSAHEFWDAHADVLPGGDTHALQFERDLPLDNLDANIVCADALFTPWPEVDAIIGNPPFLGSRYLAKEHGYEYARKIHSAFPETPKMADFCVHWFRLAHDQLKSGCRAGLVGTNAIRRNESRKASLDYVTKNGGTITEAVSTQVWSGEAQVHVSIVNWVKGKSKGPKKLFTQLGDAKDSEWKLEERETIGSTLESKTNVTTAKSLKANQEPKRCFQGQNPVNAGFFLEPEEAFAFLKKQPECRDVIFPYIIGDDLIAYGKPTRWIIDFGQREMTEAMHYEAAFERVKKLVMPVVLAKAEKEKKATGKDKTRWTRMANRWWQFRDYQPGTMKAIASIPRYIACSRSAKRPTFDFVSSDVHPDGKVVVFPFPDDYSFGILQSSAHWEWIKSRGGTQTARFTYTSDTVFDTFAWPQFASAARRDISVESKTKKRSGPVGAAYSAPDGAKSKSASVSYKDSAPSGAALADALPPSKDAIEKIRAVAEAARALRALRHEIMDANNWSLRELYKSLETPGENRLRDAHTNLDAAVRTAYGMKPGEDILAFLLKLNLELAEKETKGEPITPPGLPAFVVKPKEFISSDCVSVTD